MLQRTITRGELIAGCQGEFEAFLGGDETYADLAGATSEARRRGLAGAIYVTGTELVINATLDVLAQPAVEAKLPAEINERQMKAIRCVDRVARLMRKRGNLSAFETAHRSLYGGLTSPGEGFYEHTYRLRRFARGPFMDANLVAGGGVRALERAGIDDEPYAEILARSAGLLLFAKIDQEKLHLAGEYLGRPYADPSRYVIEDGRSGVVVDFTEEAREKLRSFQSEGSGCPSRRLLSPHDSSQSLLQAKWGSVVRYMVPEGATASDNQPKHIL